MSEGAGGPAPPALPHAPGPMRRLAPLIVLALAACQKADNQPGPGGVTQGEARALDAAAEKVESEGPPAVEPATAPQPAVNPAR